jgi:osmotically-inducible protein OsmY
MMRNRIAWVVLALLPLLHGCVAAVGGAVAGGAALAVDRRTVGTVTEDQGIELKVDERISQKIPADKLHLNVTSFNRLVLLTGEVPDEAAKEEAGRIAAGVETVKGVVNELVVGAPTSLGTRSNDSYITGQVKTRFIDANKFNALHVKVVTENSVVFLMGLVKKQEAEDATRVARTTAGVKRVVRVFEYLD